MQGITGDGVIVGIVDDGQFDLHNTYTGSYTQCINATYKQQLYINSTSHA